MPGNAFADGMVICRREPHHPERRHASAVEGYRTPRHVATPNGFLRNDGMGAPPLAFWVDQVSADGHFGSNMRCEMTNAGNGQAKRPKLATSLRFFILLILFDFAGLVSGQNISPQIKLEKALENARAITNIEIQYDDFAWFKGTPGAPPPLTNDFARTAHIRYIAAAEKFRCECRCESAQSTNVNKLTETSFDGKLWSTYDGGIWMVQQAGDRLNDLEAPNNPLVAPFLFLSSLSDDCFPGGLRFVDLRSPDIFNGLRLPEAENQDGLVHLTFSGLPRNGMAQLWRIVLSDADPDFQPSSITRIIYAGTQVPFDTEETYTLSDYTNLGEYHYPTKITEQVFTVPTNHLTRPLLVLTDMVTLVSIKIPEQIPEATFRLDESPARRIWNLDAEKGVGVGLMLGEAGSNVVVRRISADSPAEEQNVLQVGDRIVSIAQSNAPAIPVHAGKADLPRAAALLQGAKGTSVQIAFIPAGKDDSKLHVVTLVRREVKGRMGGGPVLAKGTKAPDLEMVSLTNHAVEHLSDYAGKIVVLEFWASWCSPCQKSMADLQLDPARYPDWKDKVVLLAASIDDRADIAAKHSQRKGWNQTHNVWPKTKDVRSYSVTGIPFAYVIDAKGVIVASGVVEDDRLNIPAIVNQQLNASERQRSSSF